jgi:hypothetical protein
MGPAAGTVMSNCCGIRCHSRLVRCLLGVWCSLAPARAGCGRRSDTQCAGLSSAVRKRPPSLPASDYWHRLPSRLVEFARYNRCQVLSPCTHWEPAPGQGNRTALPRSLPPRSIASPEACFVSLLLPGAGSLQRCGRSASVVVVCGVFCGELDCR